MNTTGKPMSHVAASGYGHGDGNGAGDGSGYGDSDGCGNGAGKGAGNGAGNGYGNGDSVGIGYNRWSIGITDDGLIEIGCQAHSISDWLGDVGRNLADKHNASALERAMIRAQLEAWVK